MGVPYIPNLFDFGVILWLIPILPLVASVVTASIGPARLGRHSHWPCIGALVTSCVLSFVTLVVVGRGGSLPIKVDFYQWIVADSFRIDFALRADGLTAIMLVTVTFVGSLIAIYSVGYMSGDPGYSRYFAEISLFIFAMTGLVMADNFILLYAFWEGVGLCSYLLIGFWFAKPSAAAAARKAFLVTRIGDAGLILGIVLLWSALGHDLSYDHVLGTAYQLEDSSLLAAACLLLFCGAVGKSAQFPLHVWLPDAMEGPSPVSALIHAATMVTAGVYLVARCIPLFVYAPPYVPLVVACTGGFTALLAALIALTQNDLKRVLAYSTVSQLGYMFLALGSATKLTVAAAATAAVFHLFTHAFFKALLFLAAGSVMHAMGDVIDMRRFSGLRRVLKTTHWTFLCGAAALAGVPLLSGFWSKDDILSVVQEASGSEQPFGPIYSALLISALVTAALTAFYTFRAYFKTFWGETTMPPEAGHHAHEGPAVMRIPLMILAAGALAIGMLVGPPVFYWLPHFLEHHWFVGVPDRFMVPYEHTLNLPMMLTGSLVALAGIFVAWWMYAWQPGVAGKIAGAIQGLYQLSLNKFHLDELYNALIVAPLTVFAHACRLFDQYIVDGIVDLIGILPRWLAQQARPIQNGLTQFYALAMLAGLVVFLVALAAKVTW